MTATLAPSLALTTVRRGEEADIPWLLPMLHEFAATFGSALPLWPGEEEAEATLRRFLTEGVVFVAEREGEGVGCVIGVLGPHYFNARVFVLSELVWWVAPTHRGSRAGLLLLEAFLAVGERSAHWISCSLESGSPVNERCLTKRGFRRYETAYLKEIG